MDRSLRPFSLTAVALALVIWAALEALLPVPASPPAEKVQRIDFRITGDVLGPGVKIDDLIDAEPLAHGGFQLSGIEERGPAWHFGLRNGDVVRDSPLAPLAQLTGASGPLCLSVVRDGQPLELCYTIVDPPPPVPADERKRTRDEILARVRALRLEREERKQSEAPPSERGTVTRSALEPYFGGTDEDLERMSRLGRVLLHRGPDGEFDGYRVSAIRVDTLLDELGLKNGDILTHLDEVPLTSERGLYDAYDAVCTRSSVCLRMSRRGTPYERCYDILP